MKFPIYFDHHATTPCDPRVLEAMIPFFTDRFGNPSSQSHEIGRQAKEMVESARSQVAASIGASPDEIIFTSGATESINLAIMGSAQTESGQRNHIVTTSIEHAAGVDCAHELIRRGFEVTWLSVDKNGQVDPNDVRRAIKEKTFLVSIMFANNEIGTINPVAEIGKITREKGILFHSDVVQALGKEPTDVGELGVDLLSLTAHKLYGPKGAGALYVKKKKPRIRISPLLFGGGQERGLRPGTSNVPLLVGLGEACRIAVEEMESEVSRLCQLRDRLWAKISESVPDVWFNGDPERRLPNNLSLGIEGVDAEQLMARLPQIAISTGSACHAATREPSPVLKGIGLSETKSFSVVRFGLGRSTTQEEVDHVADAVVEATRALRRSASQKSD